MMSTVLDHFKAPPSSARFSKHDSVPQIEGPSLACADIAQDRPWLSRNPEGSALAIVEGMFALVRVWRERGRTRRQLAIMSERELQDIGTCRSEIAYEVAKPFWMALAVSNAAR
jgi:uncharacterized protein YjiS (DUF1127 family)